MGAFDEFRDSEVKRMQSYHMTKGEILAEIRERWPVIQDNKKHQQDGASTSDEQPAKRACPAPPEPAAQKEHNGGERVFV